LVLHIVSWFSVGRFIWIRDRESGSSCNLCLTCFGFLWCTGSEGCPANLELIRFFGLLVYALLVDQGSRGCGSYIPLVLVLFECGFVWELGFDGFLGCSLGVSSDDGRWSIPCLQCLCFFRSHL
jgi:hypothetical protein